MPEKPKVDDFQDHVPGEIWQLFAGSIKGRPVTFKLKQQQVDAFGEEQLNALAVFEQLALLEDAPALGRVREWLGLSPPPGTPPGREVVGAEAVTALARKLKQFGIPWDDAGVRRFQIERRIKEKGIGRHTAQALVYALENPEALFAVTAEQLARLDPVQRNAYRLLEALVGVPRILGRLKRLMGDPNPQGAPEGKEYITAATILKLVEVARAAGVLLSDEGIRRFQALRWIEETSIGPRTARTLVHSLEQPETLFLISKGEFAELPTPAKNAILVFRELGKDVLQVEELKKILGTAGGQQRTAGKVVVGPDDVKALLEMGRRRGIDFSNEGIAAFKARRLIPEPGIGEATARAVVDALTKPETLYTITPAQAQRLPDAPRNAFILMSMIGKDPRRLAEFKTRAGISNPAGAPPDKVFISTRTAWELVKFAKQCGVDLSASGLKKLQVNHRLPASGRVDLNTAMILMQLLTPPGGPVPANERDAHAYFTRLLHALGLPLDDRPGLLTIVGIRGMAEGKRAANPRAMWSDSLYLLWTDADETPHVRHFPASFSTMFHRDSRGKPLPPLPPGRYGVARPQPRGRPAHAVPPSLDGAAPDARDTTTPPPKVKLITIQPPPSRGPGARLPAETQLVNPGRAGFEAGFLALLAAHPAPVIPYLLIHVDQIPGL
jgi:hypothetical protein